MNIYVVTRFSEDLCKQISPVGAATCMGGALYLLYKELNNGYKEEHYTLQEIENTLDENDEILDNSIRYSIYKTELDN